MCKSSNTCSSSSPSSAAPFFMPHVPLLHLLFFLVFSTVSRVARSARFQNCPEICFCVLKLSTTAVSNSHAEFDFRVCLRWRGLLPCSAQPASGICAAPRVMLTLGMWQHDPPPVVRSSSRPLHSGHVRLSGKVRASHYLPQITIMLHHESAALPTAAASCNGRFTNCPPRPPHKLLKHPPHLFTHCLTHRCTLL